MSNYPLGATWKANGLNGRASIRLEKREVSFEVWRWSYCYPDGSGCRSDWGTSRRMVRDDCPAIRDANGKWVRFKRITGVKP